MLVHENDPKVVKHYDDSISIPRCFYFEENVTSITVQSGATFTIITCETKLYIYKRNGQDLYDIIDCYKPHISASIIPLIDPTSILLAFLQPNMSD